MHTEPEDDFLVWHNTPVQLENDLKKNKKKTDQLFIIIILKVSLFYSTLDQNSVKYYKELSLC